MSNPRTHCLALLLYAGLSAGLSTAVAAQTPGSYEFFGLGCPGTGPGPQVGEQLNGTGGVVLNLARVGEFAFGVQARNNMQVIGFELHTQTFIGNEITMKAALYLDQRGQPLSQPAAQGQMVVGKDARFYRVIFARPVSIRASQKFWISQGDTGGVKPAIVQGGAQSAFPVYYRPGPSSAWLTWPFRDRPSYRVLIAQPGQPGTIPHLFHMGLPEVGKSFRLGVDFVPPNSAALLFFGASRRTWLGIPLPLELSFLGAPGCSLLVSNDILLLAPPAPMQSSILIQVPNSPSLKGAVFYNQWTVLDPRANRFGFSFTGAGRGQIGG
jgi:hypothetical protein